MTSQEYFAGLFDLTGHVGIITGASRGLGLGQMCIRDSSIPESPK